MCSSTHINQKSSGSFEPLAPEPQVAHQLTKGTKEKSQTQSDEEYGEREDENRVAQMNLSSFG